MIDIAFMKEALSLAVKAGIAGEVPVGAVVVSAGRIIGRGYNRRETSKSALCHAEIEAISEACQKIGSWRLCGCDIYITLEPCPMCAGAIINARIDRVIYACKDPKAGSCGSVLNLFEFPFNHSPAVFSGCLHDEASSLLRNFFLKLRNEKKKTDFN
jgi:tRNA(adenine34) deaminase